MTIERKRGGSLLARLPVAPTRGSIYLDNRIEVYDLDPVGEAVTE